MDEVEATSWCSIFSWGLLIRHLSEHECWLIWSWSRSQLDPSVLINLCSSFRKAVGIAVWDKAAMLDPSAMFRLAVILDLSAILYLAAILDFSGILYLAAILEHPAVLEKSAVSEKLSLFEKSAKFDFALADSITLDCLTKMLCDPSRWKVDWFISSELEESCLSVYIGSILVEILKQFWRK